MTTSLEKLGSQILDRLSTIENDISTVRGHASQNGGWIKINESLNTISKKVTEIDKKISDPDEGIIARLRVVEHWQRGRSDTKTQLTAENQVNRLITVETEYKLQRQKLSMMGRLGWITTSGIIAIIIKTIFDMIEHA